MGSVREDQGLKAAIRCLVTELEICRQQLATLSDPDERARVEQKAEELRDAVRVLGLHAFNEPTGGA